MNVGQKMGELALFLLYKIQENFGELEQLRKGLSSYWAQSLFLPEEQAPCMVGREKLTFISFQKVPYFVGTFT